MNTDKIIEAGLGVVMIASGGVGFLPTTIPGAALVADAFGVRLK